LVSFALGLSNFAASIGIGLSGVDARTRIRIALAFGFFEALMPIIGLLIGHALAGSLAGFGRYVGAVLLVLTGAYIIWQRLRDNDQERLKARSLNFGQLLFAGFALSFDNLVVGFALAFYHVPVLLAAGIIAVTSVGMSLIGLELGERIGRRVERWSEELSGAVLILVGLALGSGVFS
jgi:putative Mn2+ efflux pump MntP